MTLCCVCLPAKAQQKNPAATRSQHSEGAQIFSTVCASCHGLDGHGGERAPDITGNPEVQKMSDAQIAKIIHQGVPGTGMPSFRSLGPTKVQAVLAHLRSLQGQSSSSSSSLAGSAAGGRSLFFGKAGCSECHMVNGVGGFIASDLSAYARTSSPAEIREVITNPNKYLGARGNEVVATTQDGQTFTGIARNEDNFSVQLQTRDGVFHFFEKSSLRDLQHHNRSLMPSDYGSRLTGQDLDDLVSYLIEVSRSHAQAKSNGESSHRADNDLD
jgi:cytochrome c oxidase cbb3-type subunit 3